MEKVDLKAEPRKSLGSGAARRYRRAGSIPAVVYGHGDPIPVLVDSLSFEKAVRTSAGMNVILTLKVAGREDESALIRDVQRHSLSRRITHIDFQRISLTERIVASVPIEITGFSEGVKSGGILMQHIRVIEVRCLPLDIPEHITIDITPLAAIGDSIHARDLQMTTGVELVTGGEVAVVSIQPPEAEVAAPAPAEAAAAAGAEPEVIAKGKEEGAAGAKPAAGKPEAGKEKAGK